MFHLVYDIMMVVMACKLSTRAPGILQGAETPSRKASNFEGGGSMCATRRYSTDVSNLLRRPSGLNSKPQDLSSKGGDCDPSHRLATEDQGSGLGPVWDNVMQGLEQTWFSELR